MEQQFQQMAESAPQPEKPFTVKVIDRLVKQLNDTLMSSLSKRMFQRSLSILAKM
jgi:hypothetical protein